MSVKNLHSLLAGKWFIHEEHGKALLPSLHSIMNSSISTESDPEEIPDGNVAMSSSILISSNNFAGESNNDEFVFVISLKDPIYKYNQECGPRGTKSKMRILKQYEKDPNCVGIVLDIDSPGGQVSGTAEFYDFIKGYSKPVVTYTDGLMCSAAYYIGSAASHIVANSRVDAIGSIGVMIHFIDMSGYYEKQGATVITEYATKSTDKNKHFEELLKGNPEGYIKNELDPIAEDFHADMKSVRSSLDSSVLTGGTYNANDSLKLGLIDEIGTLSTAIDKVFSLAKSSSSNSNLNNSKRKQMSKLNVPLIEAVIGASFSEGEAENGIILQDADALKVEQALADKDKAITDEKAETKKQSDKVTELTANETAVTTAVQKALTEAEVEGADKMSIVEGIEALSSKVAEYGSKDGASTTTPVKNANQDVDENPNIVGGIDISAAMNN